MIADVLWIPLIVLVACALPIGGLARVLAVLSGLATSVTVAAAAWTGYGGDWIGTASWAAPLGAQLGLGGSGWTAALLMVSGVVFAAGAAASGDVQRPRAFFALWSLLQLAVAGVLVARDLILFIAFWQGVLVPLALLVWLWGGADRRRAAVRLVSHWLTADALLLTGVLALGVGARTFSLAELASYRLGEGSQVVLALLFLAAFAMRLPLFPFHTWLSRATVAAPIPVAILLVSVIPAIAVYGIATVCVPLFPHAMQVLGPYLMGLAAVGALYAAVLAFRQRDLRALLAYASVSQVGLVAIGAFGATSNGLQGALLGAVGHALAIAAVFVLAAALTRRSGTFGIAGHALAAQPVLASLFVIALLATIGLPGTAGAAALILVLTSAFAGSPGIALLASLVAIGSAAYAARVIRSLLSAPAELRAADLGWRERAIVIALLTLVIALGIVPRAITGFADRDVPALTERAR
ncbi:MAG: NADH-quinone oxidoreductase subunit M [Chloroflexota bacterium]|nr:NADH-quinone oxidoreductase subunit M [Chloroflexota bacterium]